MLPAAGGARVTMIGRRLQAFPSITSSSGPGARGAGSLGDVRETAAAAFRPARRGRDARIAIARTGTAAKSCSTMSSSSGGEAIMAEVVQVSRLLDQRGLSSFHYNPDFLVRAAVVDRRLRHCRDCFCRAASACANGNFKRAAKLGPVFSASLIGILFGLRFVRMDRGPLLAARVALISANLLFGVFYLRRRLRDQP